ncbi:hypothetical protein SeLEV6574_g04644 [Synchytrium endobioticum]|uniref:Glucosamine 6-phosphate N-acetyltransferase n=1 Tax=Synchytrium endobioticum TaxID=286115 RepID=A0A507CYF8_9FUNG|nr:hypothetical protein SeLEV6574_g04644 [Synchytrium endobioticum]
MALVSPAAGAFESKPIQFAQTDNLVFSPSLLSRNINCQLPQGYAIRPLSIHDYDHGFIQTLSQLSTTGDLTKVAFQEMYQYMKGHNDTYFPIVVVEASTENIVGEVSGEVFLERKFLHSCGKAAHIEDIVVNSSMRGKSLGKYIIEQLKHIAKETGCYKVILDCAQHNVGFYEKTGFTIKGNQMAYYFDH